MLNLNVIFRDDAKSVSIVALGCFHPVAKVQSAALHFFLGSEDEEEDSDEEDAGDVGMVPMADMLNARYGSENVRFRLPSSCVNVSDDGGGCRQSSSTSPPCSR